MRLEVVRAAVIVIASGVGVGTATIAPVRVTAQEAPQSGEAPTFTLAGRVVDAVNERPVIAAVIKVPDLRRFVFSDVRGRFLFSDFPEGTWDIVVSQLGYHTLEGSVTVTEGNGLYLRLEPDPVALEEITAGGLTYKTRLARRRNRSLARSYVLEGETLLTSARDNVWDLVGWQHGFRFEGFNDFGCPMATIYGVPARVGLYIDDRAVRFGIFEEFRPQDFALVEVYNLRGRDPCIYAAVPGPDDPAEARRRVSELHSGPVSPGDEDHPKTGPTGKGSHRTRRAMVRVRAATLPAAVLAMVVGWAARPAAAQETPTFALTGQIVDAVNERPVIAAVIKVPELRRFVFSDVNGRFHFPDFPEGTWEIVVEQLGYHTLDGSVTVSEGNGLSLRLNPDPIALEGLRVRTRSEQLLERRRRLTPYRVTRISPEIIANAINPDPTAIFRRKANSLIVPCSSDPDESMTPGCVVVRGRQKKISVMLDGLPLPGGMVVLQIYPHDHIHSMDWVATVGVLLVYTKDFIRRLDENGMSLSPLVW